MKNAYKFIFLGLLILFVSLAITSMWNNSYTDVEPLYIFQGYSYLTTGYTYNSASPILTGLIASIPLLFIDVDFPPFEEVYHPWEYSRMDFLYYGDNDPDKIIFLSRLPMVILSLIFAIYIFKWANELYGIKAGLFALFIYVLNPDILTNSTWVTTDLPVAGFMFICLYYYWKLNAFEEKKIKNLILSGVFFGLAFTTKSTALFLLPMFIILPWFFKKDVRFIISKIAILILVGITVFLLINIADIAPIYSNDDPFYNHIEGSRTPERLESLLKIVTDNQFIQNGMRFVLTEVPIPGAHSIQSHLGQIPRAKTGQPQYFLGQFTDHGTWYYYSFVYMIKTPIALILLFIGSLLFLNRLKSKKRENEFYLLTIIGIFFFIVSFLMGLNLGLRHTLLIHLVGFVFISKIIKQINFNVLTKAVITLLMIWYILASLLIYPHYISYFNEFIGGPDNGYKYLVDSNLDLGQDLKRLSFYIKEKNITDFKFKYAGFENPEYRGINNYKELNCTPTDGYIIISATALVGNLWHTGALKPDVRCFEWLRKLEPIDKVGYSIFIYNVTKQDLESL